MKEKKLVVGLLGVIAVLLAVNAVILILKNTGEKSAESSVDEAVSSAVKKAQLPPTKVEFSEKEWDFGTVKQNSHNEKIFTFKNVGDHPYVIQSAFGSCGCTVPEYPKEPIPPGGEGKIKVVYSPGLQKGQQIKTVTIVGNTEPERIVLTIKAFVVPEDTSSAVN